MQCVVDTKGPNVVCAQSVQSLVSRLAAFSSVIQAMEGNDNFQSFILQQILKGISWDRAKALPLPKIFPLLSFKGL